MFKTDQQALEKLSFAFNAESISRLRALFDLIKKEGLSTLAPGEFQRVYAGLASIEALKLEGKVYAFDVEDNYAARQGGDSGEGVELYLRQGNEMREFAVSQTRDWVLKIDQVIPKLRRAKIDTVYTGPINENFLGLSAVADDPDGHIYRKKLNQWSMGEFEGEGIKVVSLDSLV